MRRWLAENWFPWLTISVPGIAGWIGGDAGLFWATAGMTYAFVSAIVLEMQANQRREAEAARTRKSVGIGRDSGGEE